MPTALATDALLNPRLTDDAQRIVIIGGGDVGCETAHMLAFELGKTVTVVEQSSALMQASCTANRGYLIRALSRQGVDLKTATRVDRISDGGLEVTRNISSTVPAPDSAWHPVLPKNILNPFENEIEFEGVAETIETDLVLFATGLKSNGSLYSNLLAARATPELHLVGDSFRVGRIFDATKAAYAVAVEI